MSRRFLRRKPDRKETTSAAVVSGVLAAGVGLVTFYFVRLFLARDETGTSELMPPGPSGEEE